MSANALKFPESECLSYVDKSLSYYGSEKNSGTSCRTAPYDNRQHMIDAISKHGIRIPFKNIVTRADGISKCKYCGAVYSGHQMYCTNQVWWANTKSFGSNWDRGWTRSDKMLGEIHLSYSYPGCKDPDKLVVFATQRATCGSDTEWSLADEFSKQQEFFRFVAFVDGINPDLPNYLTKYRESLPPGSASEYRILYLENCVEQQSMRIDRLEGFVKMMAEKMNSAGLSLVF